MALSKSAQKNWSEIGVDESDDDDAVVAFAIDEDDYDDFMFELDEDLGGFGEFQRDLENEMDEIADRSINGEPRTMDSSDCGLPFDKIAYGMDILDDEGLVKKKIITEGVGDPPPPFARVVVHYDFYKEGSDEPFDSTYLRGKPCKLRLDEGEMIPGLEIALKSMKKKESSKYMINWQAAFGRHGCPPRIPKECNILAYISLVDYTELVNHEEDLEMTDGELKLNSFGRVFKDAKNCQCEGNEEFATGNLKSAIRSYRKCIGMLNDARLSNEEEEKRMLALKLKCLVNLSICFNKINKPEQACVVGRQALNIDDTNIKAMYQFGKANLTLSNLDTAEKWLNKAHSLKRDDDDILKLMNKLAQKKAKAKAADNAFCKRAFSYLFDEKGGDKGNGADKEDGAVGGRVEDGCVNGQGGMEGEEDKGKKKGKGKNKGKDKDKTKNKNKGKDKGNGLDEDGVVEEGKANDADAAKGEGKANDADATKGEGKANDADAAKGEVKANDADAAKGEVKANDADAAKGEGKAKDEDEDKPEEKVNNGE